MLERMTSSALTKAIDEFGDPRGYLAVASIGLPPRAAVDALSADLAAWAAADRDPQGYDASIERARESYASIVGVPASRVAQGSQTSVLTALIAAAVAKIKADDEAAHAAHAKAVEVWKGQVAACKARDLKNCPTAKPPA